LSSGSPEAKTLTGVFHFGSPEAKTLNEVFHFGTPEVKTLTEVFLFGNAIDNASLRLAQGGLVVGAAHYF